MENEQGEKNVRNLYVASRFIWILVAFVALNCVPSAFAQTPAVYPYAREKVNPTALDRYVAKPDSNFKWELAATEKEDGITSYTIALTSQQWRTAKEVNQTIWNHWLTVSVPDEVISSTALMFIDGGSNWRKESPRGVDRKVKEIAVKTKTITASVYNIPNQPLIFSDQMGWKRVEDSLIAYTWDKFYRTGDDEWPLRLPMTKAVVRAMDAVQAFCASEAGGKHEVKDFVAAGGSKRGWTTWTTGIVDTRVKAIIPCVIDLLNLIPSFRHHYAVYGGWSLVVGDYHSSGVLKWLDTPENEALMRIVDPYSYRNRLTIPKLVMNAGNDQFFVPDSSQFYWNDLKGPKWLRYVPNVGHGLDEKEAYGSVTSFYYAIATDSPIPNYEFKIETDGTIEARLLPASNNEIIRPSAVTLWQANNPKMRDYRGASAEYVDSPVAESGPGVYRAKVEPPATGWTAYFIELTFPGPLEDSPFKFTSGIRVTPDDKYPGVYKSPENPPKGFLSKNQ
jgi:PhoPQ-activated pathogenicity-related protein